MKYLSLSLNIILLIAVSFLFKKVYSEKEEVPVSITGKAADSRIVFVNSDSLMDNYNLFKQMKTKMEKKRDSLDNLLSGRGKALEREIQEYQEKAAAMSDFERQTREENLTRKQQELLSSRDNLLEKLKEEEDAMTDVIHNDLVGFLKSFNKGKGYDFILGYSKGGGILLATDSLDVTKQVVQGLNAQK